MKFGISPYVFLLILLNTSMLVVAEPNYECPDGDFKKRESYACNALNKIESYNTRLKALESNYNNLVSQYKALNCPGAIQCAEIYNQLISSVNSLLSIFSEVAAECNRSMGLKASSSKSARCEKTEASKYCRPILALSKKLNRILVRSYLLAGKRIIKALNKALTLRNTDLRREMRSKRYTCVAKEIFEQHILGDFTLTIYIGDDRAGLTTVGSTINSKGEFISRDWNPQAQSLIADNYLINPRFKTRTLIKEKTPCVPQSNINNLSQAFFLCPPSGGGSPHMAWNGTRLVQLSAQNLIGHDLTNQGESAEVGNDQILVTSISGATRSLSAPAALSQQLLAFESYANYYSTTDFRNPIELSNPSLFDNGSFLASFERTFFYSGTRYENGVAVPVFTYATIFGAVYINGNNATIIPGSLHFSNNMNVPIQPNPDGILYDENVIAYNASGHLIQGSDAAAKYILTVNNLRKTRIPALIKSATGVNSRSTITGRIASGGLFNSSAVIWSPGNQIVNLNTHVPADIPWQLDNGVAINDCGEVLGVATHKTETIKPKAFVLTPRSCN